MLRVQDEGTPEPDSPPHLNAIYSMKRRKRAHSSCARITACEGLPRFLARPPGHRPHAHWRVEPSQVPSLRNARATRLCGVGMGLDSQLLATGRGAVVTCLAKGGPAEIDGAVQIGDSLVSVDDLDVQQLMGNVRAPSAPRPGTLHRLHARFVRDAARSPRGVAQPDPTKMDLTRGVSTVLANALLGETGRCLRRRARAHRPKLPTGAHMAAHAPDPRRG